MINVVTDLLYRTEREREVQLHFIRQYFKSTGEETPVPTLLLSTAQREPIASLLFTWAKGKKTQNISPVLAHPPFFQILNRLKTKILHSKVCPLVPGVLDSRVPASCLRCVSRGWKLSCSGLGGAFILKEPASFCSVLCQKLWENLLLFGRLKSSPNSSHWRREACGCKISFVVKDVSGSWLKCTQTHFTIPPPSSFRRFHATALTHS